MTLYEWLRKDGWREETLAVILRNKIKIDTSGNLLGWITGKAINGPDGMTIYVTAHSDTPSLFRLSDYAVSSALSGPSYVLVRKESK